MRNERYDNDSKFNKNLWKTQRCGGCNILGSGRRNFGFLGPNGAGKSTTIRSMLGLIKYDQGEIRINGLDSVKDREKSSQTLAICQVKHGFIRA